jgi:cell pole-organizing protein PopZ
MEELLVTIRRIIAESEIAPADTHGARPALGAAAAPIDDGPDDFELPAMFRKEKESASARESGFVERLTDAIRSEPPPLPDAAPPPAAAAPPVAPGSLQSAFGALLDSPGQSGTPHTDESWQVLPLLSRSEYIFSASATPAPDRGPVLSEPFAEAAPAPSPGAGEVRRVMAPLKDTLIARMGRPVGAPSLRVKPRTLAASLRDAEDFCYGVATFPRLDDQHVANIDAERRQRSIPQASIGLNYLLGARAAESPDGSGSEAYLPPQLAPVEFPQLRPRAEGGTAPVGDISESTTALLRPLLMQWLDENLQQAFTRALHVEVAASARGDKS